MSLTRTPAEAALARRVVSALRGVALTRLELKGKLYLPPRARKVNDLIRMLCDAGILGYVRGTARFTLVREPAQGELDAPPGPAFDVLAEVRVSDGLEVRRVRFVDSGEERLVLRRVTRFPDGGIRARTLGGFRLETAVEVADALVALADGKVLPFPSSPRGGAA